MHRDYVWIDGKRYIRNAAGEKFCRVCHRVLNSQDDMQEVSRYTCYGTLVVNLYCPFCQSIQMEKIMKAMRQDIPGSKRILELNPDHPVVGVMRDLYGKDSDHPKLEEYAKLLYDQSLLTASLPVEDPLAFARRVSDLMAVEGKGLLSET